MSSVFAAESAEANSKVNVSARMARCYHTLRLPAHRAYNGTSQSRLNMAKKANTAAAPEWQLQTAKARFSELFRRARTEGPQRVTRHGKEAVVVLSTEQFDQLAARGRQPASLVEFFAKSPLSRARVAFDRPRDFGRPVDL